MIFGIIWILRILPNKAQLVRTEGLTLLAKNQSEFIYNQY